MINKLTLFLLPLLVLLFTSATVSGQKRTFIRSADEAFEDQRYAIAIERYQKAYTKLKRKDPTEKERIAFQLAECYRLTGDDKRAKAQYRRLIKNGYDSKQPQILLYYANMMKADGDTTEARDHYQLYISKVPEDPRGEYGLQSCDMLREWTENTTKYEVQEEDDINSREADFAPAYYNENYNALVFTSTREGSFGKKTDEWTDQNFSSLFTTRQDRKDEWSSPSLLDDQEKDGVNSDANEGTPTMSSDFSSLYFTRCPVEDNKVNGCQIYISKRTGRFFSKPALISLSFDSTEAIGHPTLSKDELLIYFSSDRPGGFGGKDIWVAFRESRSDDFGRPQNLGPIVNTPGDEMFPYLRTDTLLYFASDGHPGLGGLDIFYSYPDTGGYWSQPVNVGTPINSSADDFSIIFHPTDEKGFFSSNRNGRRSKEDIFSFIIPPVEFTLAGIVKDERTLQFVEGAKVEIVGSDGISMTARTNEVGYYMFGKSQIIGNTTYEIVVSKDDYFNSSGRITTVGEEKSKDFTRDFMLQPIPDEPIVLPEIQYDLDKWDLKPQYQDSLQGLITTLDENPFLKIELSSHTDARASFEYNDVLSQKRAQSVVDYLVERGIDPDRMLAKGYGERQPRVLNRNFEREGFTFEKGIVLNETYIDSLSTTEIKEAAHQLNRRTEFRVISKDFIPKPKNVDLAKTVEIQINPEDNVVSYTVIPKSGFISAPCIINGYTVQFVFDSKLRAQMSIDETLKLLKNGAITKEDFLGDPEEILANGTVANRALFIVKEFTVADETVQNVEIMVNSNLDFPLVIGNTVLSAFGKYTIDSEKQQIIIKKE
jgi:peptidoglycan-associated lipoprotein